MTAAPGRGQRPIRIGNCSGFYGDRASAMADMARAGGIDVLTGDYLAEVTMLILGKARAKDPTKGYAATFLPHLDAALEHLVANRIRLVVNAGGLNPGGLAAATRDLIARHGHELRVSHVDGDDVFGRLDALQQAGHPLAHLTSGEPLTSWPHQPLTANAYLGGFGIARALDNGADIVITGRVADASVVVGAAAWWWSWTPHDYDALAGAVCAGHVIECGAQATGGNFSGFRSIADLTEPGFPIAEIAADGSSVITKNPGTGGAVTTDTVTAQLLYEIGEPAYLNSDVITHLDTATLSDLGDDRVEIHGVRGSPPPPTTKVAITGIGGWENSAVLALTGTDLDAKAALVERSVRRYADSVDGIDAVALDRIGRAQHDPDSQDAATELLRIAVQGTEQAAGRAFSSRMVELALSSYPGLYALGPPQPGSAFGVYWPALLDQSIARAHRPPPRRHHRDHRPRHGTRRRGCGGAARRTVRWRRRRRHRRATSWSSSRSVSSCMPAPATKAATRTSVSGYATGPHGTGSRRPSPSTSSDACFPKHASSRSRATSSPTWAPSTSCSEDCSEPAPPRPCASTRKPRRSANGCAHAASRCRALLWRPQLVGACDMDPRIRTRSRAVRRVS